MDLSRFKTSDWLLIGGALGFLIFGTFVDWLRISVPGFVVSGLNAFDFFWTGTIPWILIVGSGVIAVMLALGAIRPGSAPWPIILVATTGLGTLLVLIRLIAPGAGEDIPGISRGAGLWLSFLSAAVALAGAVMTFTAAGGNLRDLTDVDKLRGTFDRPDRMPPPPPPSSSVTPPPPPRDQPPAPPPPAV